jgi:hypothetical protein
VKLAGSFLRTFPAQRPLDLITEALRRDVAWVVYRGLGRRRVNANAARRRKFRCPNLWHVSKLVICLFSTAVALV